MLPRAIILGWCTGCFSFNSCWRENRLYYNNGNQQELALDGLGKELYFLGALDQNTAKNQGKLIVK